MLYIVEKIVWKSFMNLLREHAKNIIDFEKKKLLALTKEELNPHKDTKECYIWGQRILKNLPKLKVFEESKVIDIIQINAEAQHIALEI